MIVAIVGPTASGKTALSIALARKYNGEIISADSRQVYRGMDIGSGKATRGEMRGVRHHMLDVASPRSTFSVGQYQAISKKILKGILTRRKLPIVVGGTGFYIDSLLYNYALPSVKPDPALRRKLEKQSAEKLFAQLKKLDPARAANIDPHNPRRLVRALEIVLATGRPVPNREAALAQKTEYPILKIGLNPSAPALKKNIAARLAKRFRAGMIREVERLHANGVSWKKLDDFGLEYRYVSRYLRGMITKEQMIARIEKESWHYAKRQMTWFKRDKQIHWVKNKKQAQALVKQFIKRK
ncbi:MAG TPA: tRNA (adenosine(37)-N6)-dimethylallyltransferase MiaA [Candidatus Paceibacterota bacterium]|nr:tRNA (adenosine(37)-N6)-dimethylallyltransferase MiaA [Candidatus Paceibacterota bacterium]